MPVLDPWNRISKKRIIGKPKRECLLLIFIFRLPQRSEEASKTTSGSDADAADDTSNFITRDWLDLGQIFKKHMPPLIFMNFSKKFR